MNTIISAAARRTIISTLATLAFSVALPEAGFAHSTLLTIERTKEGMIATTQDLDAKGKPVGSKSVTMYPAGTQAPDTFAIKRVDDNTVEFTRMRDGKVVQTGRYVRSGELCGFRCQAGIADKRRALTFITTDVHEAPRLAADAPSSDKP